MADTNNLHELHAHASGTAKGTFYFDKILEHKLHLTDAQTINSLTEKFGLKLADEISRDPSAARSRFAELYTCYPTGRKMFKEIMDRFVFSAYVMENIPGIKRELGKHSCQSLKEQGIGYVEWQVDPFSATKNETAEEGLEKIREFHFGMKEIDISSMIVLTVAKHRYNADGKINYKKIEYARRQMEKLIEIGKDEGLPIVGIGAVNKEITPLSSLSPILSLSHRFNLGLSPHAGECTSPTLEDNLKTVEDALDLGAHRLGHAVSSYMPIDKYVKKVAKVDDYGRVYDKKRVNDLKRRQSKLLERMYESGVVVEVSPIATAMAHYPIKSYEDHPVDRLVEYGISIVVCTDDAGIYGCTLMDEINKLAEAKKLDRNKLINNAELYSFKNKA